MNALDLSRNETQNREKIVNIVVIKQIDAQGLVYRTFTRHVEDSKLDAALSRIAHAYNLNATEFEINGTPTSLALYR